MKKKEAWPGAGIDIDLFDPALDRSDHEKIRRHLKQLPDTAARLQWLERFFIEFEYQHPDWRNYRTTRNTNRRADFAWELRKACEEEHNYWQAIAKTEAAGQPAQETAANSPAPNEQAADEQAPGKWTNEQAAVALYALLRAADLPEKHNKMAVARFAHLLTGRSQDKMRKAGYEAAGCTFSDDAAKAVVEEFERMGLAKLAAAIRNKDFTKL